MFDKLDVLGLGPLIMEDKHIIATNANDYNDNGNVQRTKVADSEEPSIDDQTHWNADDDLEDA